MDGWIHVEFVMLSIYIHVENLFDFVGLFSWYFTEEDERGEKVAL